jgi:predicted secreted protein
VNEIISASPDKEFEIVLEGIPTAGYSWKLIRPLDKDGVVQELGHELQRSTSLVGGSAHEHFRFRALADEADGEVQLRFRYRPSMGKQLSRRANLSSASHLKT